MAERIRANASGVVSALNIRNILIASGVLVGSNVLRAGKVYWWAGSNLQAAVTSLDTRLMQHPERPNGVSIQPVDSASSTEVTLM